MLKSLFKEIPATAACRDDLDPLKKAPESVSPECCCECLTARERAGYPCRNGTADIGDVAQPCTKWLEKPPQLSSTPKLLKSQKRTLRRASQAPHRGPELFEPKLWTGVSMAAPAPTVDLE